MLTTRLDVKAIKAAHVNQVHRGRRVIEDAAAELIERQLRDAAQELEDNGIAKTSAIFRPRDWDQRLKGAIGPAIGRVMAYGAMSELRRYRRGKGSKSTASDLLAEWGIDADDWATEMPDSLVDSIELALYDSFQRPYWAHVNSVTAGRIETLIRDGTTEGLSIRDMAHELRVLAPGYSRSRATAIARTESSRALNAGHVEGIQEIERDAGIKLGKTWLSVNGSTTRQSHADADGQTVASDEPFYVGGHPCQFPGDADLPPEEAINCLCTLTTI